MIGKSGINNMSVAQYAELLGISTQAVYKRIKDDNLEIGKVAKEGKRTYISVTNDELQWLQNGCKQENNTVATDQAAEIAALRELLAAKEDEVQRLRTEANRLHEHLSTAQAGLNEALRQAGALQHKVNQLESVTMIELPEEPVGQNTSAAAEHPGYEQEVAEEPSFSSAELAEKPVKRRGLWDFLRRK